MEHLGAFAVPVAFFVFLTVSAVAGIVADYKKRELAIEPLRAAIERGQPLDPQLVERLMAPEPRDERLNPMHLRVGGIITIAAAVGLAILAFLLAQLVPVAFYPLLGAAAVATCTGVGLLISARVAERQGDRQGTRGP